MNQLPYEYSAIKYLQVWIKNDARFHKYLSKRNIDATLIAPALQKYKVARNFRGLSESGRTDKIADLLVKYSKHLTQNNVSDKVIGLAEAFHDEFNSNNLSAASKLLWLRKRSPIVIFDSRARNALNNLGHNIRVVDYDKYLQCWREEFSIREVAIRAAASRLPEIKEFTAMWCDEREAIQDIVTSDWFVGRVFDNYLWEVGADK